MSLRRMSTHIGLCAEVLWDQECRLEVISMTYQTLHQALRPTLQLLGSAF